jgi:hypothetical protein
VTEQRPLSSVEFFAVDIDGQQVVVLSPAQTSNFLPLVRRADSEGHELDDVELEQLFAANRI